MPTVGRVRFHSPVIMLLCLLLGLWVRQDALAFPSQRAVTAQGTQMNLAPLMSVYEDTGAQQRFDQISILPDGAWQLNHGNTFSKGYTDAAWWMTTRLEGSPNGPSQWILELDTPFTGWIDVWLVSMAGTRHYATGLARPWSERPLALETFAVPIELPPGKGVQLVIRLRSEGALLMPVTLYERGTFHELRSHKQLLMGAFFSLCAVLGLYNLMLYVAIRDSSYLFYTLNVGAMMWLQASLRGYTVHYFWHDHWPAFTYIEPTWLVWVCTMTTLMFSLSFLKLRHRHPRLFNWLQGLTVFSIAMVVFTLFIPPAMSLAVFNAAAGAMIFSVWVISGYSYKHGHSPARFFIAGSGTLLLGALLLTLYYQGAWPDWFIARHAMIFGGAIEAVLMSLALADRISWTQQQRKEAQREAASSLQRSNRLKQQFLLSVSQELQGPLHRILGTLSLKRQETALHPLQRHDEAMSESVQHVVDAVDGLLCLSELNSGVARINEVHFDWAQRARRWSHGWHHHCENLGLSLQTSDHIPAGTHFAADIDKWQVILNQSFYRLSGALAFGSLEWQAAFFPGAGDGGRVHAKFSFALRQLKPHALEPLKRLFTPPSSPRADGMVDDTHMPHLLLAMLGGSARIDLSDSHFAFDILLPCRQVSATTPVGVERAGVDALIIEDNPVNQKILHKLLERLGCHVRVADNGALGLDAVNERCPDVIFMDCQMPVMDGFEATHHIRRRHDASRLPIVAVTANALSQDRQRCLEAGMNDYLVKPVRADDIRAALARWCPARERV